MAHCSNGRFCDTTAEPDDRIELSRAHCLHQRRRPPRWDPVINITTRMCPRSPTDGFTHLA
jgi:hypothetical protein